MFNMGHTTFKPEINCSLLRWNLLDIREVWSSANVQQIIIGCSSSRALQGACQNTRQQARKQVRKVKNKFSWIV